MPPLAFSFFPLFASFTNVLKLVERPRNRNVFTWGQSSSWVIDSLVVSLVSACKFDRLLLAQSFRCFGASKKSRRVQKLAFVEYLFLGKIQIVLSGSQK